MYSAIGNPYAFSEAGCRLYYEWFKPTKAANPGIIIVGNDGKHCAILNEKANAFIHANPVTKTVTETPIAMINAFFRKGYVLREYTCELFP